MNTAETRSLWHADREQWWTAIDQTTRHLDAPVIAVSLEAFDANLADLRSRAAGLPIRTVTKSVRVRSLLRRAEAAAGYTGLLAYTLPEALWLSQDHDDIVVGYPTANTRAIGALARDDSAAGRVTLMIDDTSQLDLIDAVVGPRGRPPIRVCLDLDASLRSPPDAHFGVRRSPVHTASALLALARAVVGRAGFVLDGVMAYEAQIAGVANRGSRRHAVRAQQAASFDELLARRAEAIAAVRQLAPIRFVNAGGTGSLELTATDPVVTELAAGSGLLGPHLFDHYESFTPAPASGFGLDVVRRPTADIVTLLGGGWVASGAAGADRLPEPVHPPGLTLLEGEGAGEVQTPVAGALSGCLRIGDRVWFRHAKAGEIAEHANVVAVVDGILGGRPSVVDIVPTYRGEGRVFA